MLLNFILLAAIVFLGYWWSLQGFFSAFLHLMSVVIAGALALAIWEPAAGVLMPVMSVNGAWGVALMGPFLIFLMIIRLGLDNFARGDVKITPLVDYTGGGICGVLATCLAAGITLISVGFLPLGPAILGYQPLLVGADGKLVSKPGGDLWIPVDTTTSAFYTYLSGGSFFPWSSTPLESYQPSLARQAVIFRMGDDPNSSTVAMPGGVTADDCLDTETPINYLDDDVAAALEKASGGDTRVGDHRLITVATTWKTDPKGTYDLDGFLRVYPPQIRLVSIADADKPELPVAELEAPVAFSREDPESHAHVFTAISSPTTFFYSTAQTNKITWVFVIPAGRHPQFLLARHSRLELAQYKKDDRLAMKESVGHLTAPLTSEATDKTASDAAKPPDAKAPNVGLREGRHAGTAALDIKLTADLPNIVSQNLAAPFTLDKQGIVAGDGDIAPSESGVSRELAVTHVAIGGGRASVRVEVAKDQAESLLGASIAAAASLAPVYLEEKGGDKYQVVGYALMKSADRHMVVHVNLESPLQSSRELPVRDMQKNDRLYLYFAVPKGVTLVAFHVGQGTKQEVDPPLVVK